MRNESHHEPTLRSGRLLLRLPAELHTRAAQQAAARGMSLNRWLLDMLAVSLADPARDAVRDTGRSASRRPHTR